MVAVLITDCATVASFPDTLRDIARTPDLMQRLYLLLFLLQQERLSEWTCPPTGRTRWSVPVVAMEVTLLHSAGQHTPT